MKNIQKVSMQFFLALALLAAPLIAFQLQGTEALAQSSYFSSRGCVNCHSTPVAATCAGCHQHSGTLTATKNKTTSYTPGETVTITLSSSGARSGWIGVRLYDQTGAEIARSSGSQSGMGGSATYPAVLSAPAPATAGTYTWRIAYFGNENGTGSGDVHSETAVNVSITVASAADIVAPVVSFTLPATATSLTVTVSSLTATDNVAVTGYLVNKSATVPAASAAGWTATAPASITAVAGSNTFYAWAKDAAGNVSAVKSATVTVSLPDATAPVVGTFTLPATATNLTILVSSFTATDNVAVTGYLITTSATAPAASVAGWTASAPATVIAVVGSNTYYAWARDAAGNVSSAKSATVLVALLDTIAPVVGAFSLPATSASLTVTVSAFTATDNVAVTGYLITTSSTAPAASAAGWTASAPATVTAVAGANTFYAWARDAAGNVSLSKIASVTITSTTADTTKPTLTISSLANGAFTNVATLNVSGNASDTGGLLSVTVNGQAVTIAADGSFSHAVTLTAGANIITTIATDIAGNQQTDTRTISFDPTAPVLTITAPADNSTTTQSFMTVTGTISETSTVTISINNSSPQSAASTGNSFSASVNLVTGINTIDITATDAAGNTATAKRTVTYANSNSSLTLAVTNPSQDVSTKSASMTLMGTVVGASGNVTVSITMDGKSYTPKVEDGAFKQHLTFTKTKLYAITVTATDEAGNSSSIVRNVIYRPSNNDNHDNDHHDNDHHGGDHHNDDNHDDD
ncbi:MAG TPA: hypothetical protein HPP97_13230 [Desulfuromonadales bacterium]|nr:hypothetical protein [Desulfuromonadales bacterium]